MQGLSGNQLNGIDVSVFQNVIDWDLVAQDDKAFAYIRAGSSSTGNEVIDANFITNAQGARAAGIPAGGYYFCVPSDDLGTAIEQANFFIQILQAAFGTDDFGDLIPVIDIETPFPRVDANLTTDELLDWVDTFRNYFEMQTGRRLMIYTGIYFIDEYQDFFHSVNGHILADMPLWVAYVQVDPANNPPPDRGGWTEWRVWQYTFDGFVGGITNLFSNIQLGTGNGTQTIFFTTAAPVIEDSIAVYLDGVLQVQGVDYAWFNDAGRITFFVPPAMGVVVTATYSAEAVDLDFGPDTIAELTVPSQVQGFQAEPDSQLVLLSWTENTEPDLANYLLFQDGVLIATLPAGTSSHTVTGLTNGQTYEFTIKAQDTDDDIGTGSTVFATPNVQLLHLRWVPPASSGLPPIDFGEQFGPYVIQEIQGEGSTLAAPQSAKAPFQVGESLLNTDVQPRLVSLSLRIVEDSRTALFERRKELTKAFAFEPTLIIDPINLYEQGTLFFFRPTFQGEQTLFLEALPQNSPQFTLMEGNDSICDADIQFYCAYPFWQELSDNEGGMEVVGIPQGGFEMPFEMPFEFAALQNTVTILNEGDVRSAPTIRVFGFTEGFIITNETTGESFKYDGTIFNNEFVSIFTEFGQKRVIYTNSLGAEFNAFVNVDFNQADFFSLVTGENVITVEFFNEDQFARAFVDWTHRFGGV